MSEQEQQEGVPADLLKRAGAAPGQALEDYNPMEVIPTLTVGKDWEEGMVISGYVDETQILASHKFKFATKKNADGVPISLRHILRIGSPTGDKLGVWSCGELKMAFEKLPLGTFVSITYKGKGENAKNQEQHFFEYKRGAAN